MLELVTRKWAGLNRHWLGRVFGAILLPGWVLIIASTEHGSPSVTSVAAPVVYVILLVGSLVGAGLSLWVTTNRKQAEAAMQAWVADQPEQTHSQKMLGLIGGVAFLASGYQVVSNFDVFSRFMQDRHWLGSIQLASWDTLLILCAIQFVFFFAQANVSRRN